MKDLIKKWLSKSEEDSDVSLPKNAVATFLLKVDDIDVGYLRCNKGLWNFEYSEEFKKSTEYNPIIGFPDLDSEYTSTTLWPFFKIRIPGLKQPAIRDKLALENIDKTNEFELLKRFGHKTISNPYELLLI